MIDWVVGEDGWCELPSKGSPPSFLHNVLYLRGYVFAPGSGTASRTKRGARDLRQAREPAEKAVARMRERIPHVVCESVGELIQAGKLIQAKGFVGEKVVRVPLWVAALDVVFSEAKWRAGVEIDCSLFVAAFMWAFDVLGGNEEHRLALVALAMLGGKWGDVEEMIGRELGGQ